MKIENNQIRISGQSHLTDTLGNLREGSRIVVKISDRLGQKYAILDIGGHNVKAEFLQGVPKANSLFLILETKTGDTLFFRIEEGSLKENLIRELNSSTIFSLNDLNKPIYELRMQLREGITGIFLLNKALLKHGGFIEENVKDDKLLNVMNKLLSRGADYKDLLLFFTLMNPAGNRQVNLFYNLLSLMLPGYNQIFEKDNINERIANLLNFLNKAFSENDKDDKTEVIRMILDSMPNKPERENRGYGEIVFFDDNKFKLCRYILKDDNMVISLDLSFLGSMDILIRQDKSACSISFFCEKNEAVTVLKSEINILKSALKANSERKTTTISINFFNSKKSIKKIIEIISAIDLNNIFDAKA